MALAPRVMRPAASTLDPAWRFEQDVTRRNLRVVGDLVTVLEHSDIRGVMLHVPQPATRVCEAGTPMHPWRTPATGGGIELAFRG